MSLGRKFDFFSSNKTRLPNEIKGEIQCWSSTRGRIILGTDNGFVSFLDNSFQLQYSFRAYSSSITFLQQLKQRSLLLTAGQDEESVMCLKVFNLDKRTGERSSPECIQKLQIFTSQFPEAKITCFSVYEAAPQNLLIVLGLDNGCIYGIQGDIVRKRILQESRLSKLWCSGIKRFKIEVDNKTKSPVTGLGFRDDGLLFAVTTSSVSFFNLQKQPTIGQKLSLIGSETSSVVKSGESWDVIIGRPEAVYFYQVDVGRGPCSVVEGEKKFVSLFRGYLVCVIADQTTGKNILSVYDLKNHLIAYRIVVGEVSHMLCECGNILLLLADKSALFIVEKDMHSKLDMLYKKSLYHVAVNLVQSRQCDAAAAAEVLRKYGDHLYEKHEYDEAMDQYILTIGHLESSYVLKKFWNPQRTHNLKNYLEKLQESGLASEHHTTLLLNCYVKLKDVKKLNSLITSEDGEQKFDVDIAIGACREANYLEQAMYVAKKSANWELYLEILVEDLYRYDEAMIT